MSWSLGAICCLINHNYISIPSRLVYSLYLCSILVFSLSDGPVPLLLLLSLECIALCLNTPCKIPKLSITGPSDQVTRQRFSSTPHTMARSVTWLLVKTRSWLTQSQSGFLWNLSLKRCRPPNNSSLYCIDCRVKCRLIASRPVLSHVLDVCLGKELAALGWKTIWIGFLKRLTLINVPILGMQ